jgi:peptidoglycan-N-acetylglucosamine deacetylase
MRSVPVLASLALVAVIGAAATLALVPPTGREAPASTARPAGVPQATAPSRAHSSSAVALMAPIRLLEALPVAPAARAEPSKEELPQPGTSETLVASSSLAQVIRHGPRTRRAVALTFDDGWGEDACRSITDTLRAHGVKATFFINGIHLRDAPAKWRAILQGFPVANHTRTHRWLTRISEESIRRQIRLDERVHELVLGRPMLKLLRPPYGAYDDRVLRIAPELGYRRILLWDVSGGDAASGATVASVVRHATRGQNGSIVLLHCGPSMTPAALPAIIRSYRSRGFDLVGLDTLLGG